MSTILLIVLILLVLLAPTYIVCNVRVCYNLPYADPDEVKFLRAPLILSLLLILFNGRRNVQFVSFRTYYGMMQKADEFLEENKDKLE